MTTTVLAFPILKTLELEDCESWALTQLPEYYRLAKGDDRLPLEELIGSEILECICDYFFITTDAFAALGVTASLPRGDDKLKFAKITRFVCPFSNSIRKQTRLNQFIAAPTLWNPEMILAPEETLGEQIKIITSLPIVQPIITRIVQPTATATATPLVSPSAVATPTVIPITPTPIVDDSSIDILTPLHSIDDSSIDFLTAVTDFSLTSFWTTLQGISLLCLADWLFILESSVVAAVFSSGDISAAPPFNPSLITAIFLRTSFKFRSRWKDLDSSLLHLLGLLTVLLSLASVPLTVTSCFIAAHPELRTLNR